MTLALTAGGVRPRRNYRRRRIWGEVGALSFAVLLLVWTLTPIYNIIAVALEAHGDVFTNDIFPSKPSLESFWVVITQGYWYLEYFWRQFENSVYIGIATVFFTLAIGSLASFAIGRMRIRYGWMVSNAALLTYVIPASFLAIPFYRIMGFYGLSNNLWSVIAAEVTFATPYAIFIFQQYGVSIPIELDEAARIDGASPAGQRGGLSLPEKCPAVFARSETFHKGVQNADPRALFSRMLAARRKLAQGKNFARACNFSHVAQ